MKNWHGFLLLIILFGYALPALAAPHPSFDLDDSVWHATDVVVVTEEEHTDGRCTVIESWKGDLKAGDSVSIPELAVFAPESTRTVDSWFTRQDPILPRNVTGTRMVLFLKRAEGAPGDWKPANYWNNMKVSVVWIEHGDTYAFFQVMSFGPAILVPLHKVYDPIGSEVKMKALASDMIRTQEALARATAIQNPSQRAPALRPLVDSPHSYASFEAFAELSKCGEAALPVLTEMLKDDTLLPKHARVVEVIGRTGGAAAGAELTSLVERETEFWKQAAPSLKVGWWNDTTLAWSQRAILHNRYSRLQQALRALKDMRYPGCKAAVTRLRDFWRSFSQLEDKSGLNQMSEECDNVLRALRGAR